MDLPLINDWPFYWQALTLAFLIPAIAAPFLIAAHSFHACDCGYKDCFHLPDSKTKIVTWVISSAVFFLVVVASVGFFVAAIISGIVLPTIDWPFYTQGLALAVSCAMVALVGLALFDGEKEQMRFSWVAGVFMAPMMVILVLGTLLLAAATVIFIGLATISGVVAFVGVDIQPSANVLLMAMLSLVFLAISMTLLSAG